MELTVKPIHFEDRSGTEFERIVFAYAIRSKDWDTIEWLGQTGKDGGRDIWGQLGTESTCYLCANYQNLTFKKAKEDIDKLIAYKTIPTSVIVVCGGKVTSGIRKQIKDYANLAGITSVETWSGVELEERLRKDTPELVRRFVMGEKFPDSPKELIQFAKALDATNDRDIIDLLVECFDRPAFITPFHMESNLPDFEQALKNTIEVLNTGVHRSNDGAIIRTIPSRHRVSDKHLKKGLEDVTTSVVKLRDIFKSLLKSKEIEHCSCDDKNCPTFSLSPSATKVMDDGRKEIFAKFKKIKPDFNLSMY